MVTPVAGSALPGGQSPRLGFFREAQPPDSAADTPVPLVPFVCAEDADMVDVVELLEAMEEEEFWRWTDLRGPGANILLTSSEFMAEKPLPLELHPMRVLG